MLHRRGLRFLRNVYGWLGSRTFTPAPASVSGAAGPRASDLRNNLVDFDGNRSVIKEAGLHLFPFVKLVFVTGFFGVRYSSIEEVVAPAKVKRFRLRLRCYDGRRRRRGGGGGRCANRLR
jgi:hypothetical protein